MTSKFMKLNQLVVPMITLVLLVSQLTGCALFNREDTEKILEENEQVELVIPDKADTEENLEYTGSEKPYEVEVDEDTSGVVAFWIVSLYILVVGFQIPLFNKYIVAFLIASIFDFSGRTTSFGLVVIRYTSTLG